MILARAKDMGKNKDNESKADNSSRAEMLRIYQKWCKENENNA